MSVILPHAAAGWEPYAAAGITLIVALAAAVITDRLLRSTEHRLAARPGAMSLDSSGRTRLRFVRRLAWALIMGTGIFLALLQFDSFDRLARAALTSGVVLSAILGLAARETLGNMIAGLVIAVTQPLRVGDHIEVGEVSGVVEDVTLTFTWVRTGDGGRVILPNQLLTTSPVRNDSIREHHVVPRVTVWVAPEADEAQALAVLGRVPGASGAVVADTTAEGLALRVSGPSIAAAGRDDAEAALRAAALAALRTAGIPRAGAAA
jgi:small-conductance mechanosensitive channel